MAESYRPDSFLQNTELRAGRFLGVNQLPKIPRTVNDEVYVIGHGYEQRPDLLAHELYGNSRLWWVFALRNPDVIKDPIRDFRTGISIVLSPRSVVDSVVGRS